MPPGFADSTNPATVHPSSAPGTDALGRRVRIRKRRRSRPHVELGLLFAGLAVVAAGITFGLRELVGDLPAPESGAGVVSEFRPSAPRPDTQAVARTGPRQVAIPVTLLGEDEQPVEGVALHAVPANPRASGWERWSESPVGLTDEDGCARVALLSSRRYRLLARTGESVAWSDVVDPSDPARVTLRLGRSCALTGSISSTDGTPLPGARVQVVYRGTGGRSLEAGGAAIARGAFELPPVPRDRYAERHRIRVTAPGHRPLEREFAFAELGDQGLRVVLDRSFR